MSLLVFLYVRTDRDAYNVTDTLKTMLITVKRILMMLYYSIHYCINKITKKEATKYCYYDYKAETRFLLGHEIENLKCDLHSCDKITDK